jgi:hypothetical protein
MYWQFDIQREVLLGFYSISSIELFNSEYQTGFNKIGK